jgi:hypothetical protein
MKLFLAAISTLALALDASAQVTGGSCGGFGSVKSAADIQALLSNRYACDAAKTWNELHTGGSAGDVTDYKKGPADPVDPSEKIGTYTITAGSGPSYDRITYDYGTGGSFTYAITPKNGTGPGTYTFCNIATGQSLTIIVQAAHC